MICAAMLAPAMPMQRSELCDAQFKYTSNMVPARWRILGHFAPPCPVNFDLTLVFQTSAKIENWNFEKILCYIKVQNIKKKLLLQINLIFIWRTAKVFDCKIRVH